MSKRKKYILISLGAMFGLVIIALVGARVYLSTSHAQKTIQAKINAALPGAITWDDLSLSLSGGRVELTNFLLAGPAGEKLAGFDRLYVDLAVSDLFKKTVTVASFALDKPWADLKTDENGDLNLLKAFPKPGPATEEPKTETGGELPVSIAVASARITDGRFSYEDLAQHISASVSGVGLTANATLPSLTMETWGAFLRFEIRKGDIQSPELSTQLDSFLAEATLKDGRIDPVTLHIKTPPAQLDLSGTVAAVFDDPDLDLTLDTRLALADIRDLLALEPPLSGDLTLKLVAKGPVGNPNADLSLAYGGGDLLDYKVKAIALDAALADRLLDLKTLLVDTTSGRASLTGRADARNAFPDGFLSKTMDLNALSYRLHLTGNDVILGQVIPESAGVRGTAGTDIIVDGKGVLYPAIAADVTLDLGGKEIRAPGIQEAIDVAANLDATLDNGATTIRTLSINAGDADLSASGTFDIPNLTTTADLDLKAPNLGRTLAAVGVGGIQGGATLKAKVDGPVTAPVFDVDLTGNGLAYEDITVGDIRLDAESNKDGVVKIATLSIKNNGSEIDLNGTAGVFGPSSLAVNPDLPLAITLALKNVEAGDFLKEPPVAGRFSGTLKADGALKNLTASIDLSARDLGAADAAIGDVDLRAGFAEGQVRIENLTVKNRTSAVQASGTASVLKPGTFDPLADPTFDIALSSDRIVPGEFVPDAAGTLALDASVGGSASRPTADVNLSGRSLRFADIRIGDADVDVQLAPSGLLTINRLSVANQGSSITGKGTLQLYKDAPGFDPTLPLDLALTLAEVEAGDFIQDEPAKGTLSGAATVTGSIKAPKADLDLRARNLAAAGNTIGDVDVTLGFADGRARIEEITVKNKDSNLRISGTAQVLSSADMTPLADPTFDLAVASDGIFLQNFLPDLKGKVVLNADVTGSVKQPRGTVNLAASGLDLGAQKIDAVSLAARMTGDRIRLDPLKVTIRNGETLTATGTYTLPDAYDLAIRSSGISLSSIDAVRKADVARGTVRLDLSGRGTIADAALSGDIGISDLKVQGKPLDDVKMNLRVGDGRAQVAADAGFRLDADYNLNDQTFTAAVDFPGTDLGPYFELADQSDLGGLLTGRITAEGNAGAPDAVTARVDLSRLLLTYQETELIAADRLDATFRNGAVTIPGFSLDLLRKGNLTVRGNVDLDGPMSVTVNGDIPLSVARAFTDAVPDLSGTLGLSADVGGRTTQPAIKAEVDLRNIAMSVPGIAQRLHDLNGKIRMSPDSLRLSSVSGKLDDGRFTLNGDVGLKNFQPDRIDVGLKAEALPVRVPDMLEILINADLGMNGTPEKSTVGGEVVLLEGSYFKDVNLNLITPLKGLTEKKRETAPAAPPRPQKTDTASEPSILDNVELDIFVKNRAPFLVDNNLAYMEIHPDLKVEGNVNTPLIAGRAEIRSGSVTYQDRTFEITKGDIDFLNPYKIEPTLDIAADSTIRDWRVTLNISGVPDALNFNLSSKPSLDDGDILSLIMFGRTAGEMISGEGGTTQAPGQMVADIVSSTVGDDIKKATGLDILEVELQDDAEAGGSDVKVTMGKELSRRMSVKYSVESKDGEMVGRTSAEYKILENLLMSGFQDNTGTFGGELTFRLEFR